MEDQSVCLVVLALVVLACFTSCKGRTSVTDSAQLGGDATDGNVSLDRRTLYADEKYRWPKGIVPYVFDPDTATPTHRREVLATFNLYKKYTCLRFVPWVKDETMKEHGLPNNHYALFVMASGCWSTQGYRGYNGGSWQKCNCCSRVTCIHELGHLMGFYHEQSSPKKHGYMATNIAGVESGSHWMYGTAHSYKAWSYRYDITSRMHYKIWMGRSDQWDSFQPMFPELKPVVGIGNFLDIVREVTIAYKCAERHCQGKERQCENDGFFGFYENGCSCICPPGLDPDTDCRTIRKLPSETRWPADGFRLLAGKEGCPPGTTSQPPSRYDVSTASSTSTNRLSSEFSSTYMQHVFCAKAKVQTPDSSAPTWPEGQYCIFKDGVCPEGFEEGGAKLDDVTSWAVCCRQDGYEDRMPLQLPSSHPLVLLPVSGFSCPTVEGMDHEREWFTFRNEAAAVAPEVTGMVDIRKSGNKLTVYYCHYVPLYRGDCGGVIELSAESNSSVISSPAYPSTYPSPAECFWMVKAPKGATVVVEFLEMSMEKKDGECVDLLEIRHNFPTQVGLKYCGSKIPRGLHSIHNTVHIRFRSNREGAGKFSIKASLVDPAGLCYQAKDRGVSYRGTVNYTREDRPCLPWRDVSNCLPSFLLDSTAGAPLEENFCRNPDNTFRPWCFYDNVDGRCLRNYCDVCQLEKHHDNYPDCAELAKTDFCTRDPQEAQRGCARACASFLPHPPVTPSKECRNPCAMDDAVLAGANEKPSYNAGETVTCKCNTSSDLLEVTCLTDGTWSVPASGYVCGVCPNGWTRRTDGCYRHFYEMATFQEARDTCAEHGSIIAPMYTAEQKQTFVRLKEAAQTTWVGLSDEVEEGKFVWTDGTPAGDVDWYKGGGRNSGRKDCVAAYSLHYNYTLDPLSCSGSHRYPFLCRKSLTERKICRDQRTDCQAELQQRPALCRDFPGFAADTCPKTCGVCTDPQDPCGGQKCELPAPDASVRREGGGGSLGVGGVAYYSCQPGLKLHTGNLHRACLRCGVLTGSPPVCKEKTYPYTVNEVPLVHRLYWGSADEVFLGSPSMKISTAGEVTEWRYYSDKPGTVAFQVWRPRPDKCDTCYEIVGSNEVTITVVKRETNTTIDAVDRIQVQAGDSVAVDYVQGGGVGPGYTLGMAGRHPQHVGVVSRTVPFPQPGTVLAFAESSDPSLLFSFSAEVGAPGSTSAGSAGWTSVVPIVTRGSVGAAGWVYSGTTPQFRVPRDGVISRWQFFSEYSGQVALQAYRPSQDFASLQFLGQNVVTTVDNAVQNVEVTSSERIPVKKGDVIAVYYGHPRGGIPYSSCSDSDLTGVFYSQTSFSSPADFQAGQQYGTSSQRSCRVFSLRALVTDA